MTKRKRAVLLDRDGTIIKHVHHLTKVEQVEILPGVTERIKAINDAGWLTIVVTNQSVIGRGLCKNEDVLRVHDHILDRFAGDGAKINGFIWCPHLPDAGCYCRKPRPGMLYIAAYAHKLDLRECLMIGDSECDMLAARAALCHWFPVKTDVGLAQWDPARLGKVREIKVLERT